MCTHGKEFVHHLQVLKQLCMQVALFDTFAVHPSIIKLNNTLPGVFALCGKCLFRRADTMVARMMLSNVQTGVVCKTVQIIIVKHQHQ